MAKARIGIRRVMQLLTSSYQGSKINRRGNMVKSIQVIEQHSLSNGDTVKVTKLGRDYSYVRLFCEDQAPYIETGINLKQAISLLAGAIQQDVSEVD